MVALDARAGRDFPTLQCAIVRLLLFLMDVRVVLKILIYIF